MTPEREALNKRILCLHLAAPASVVDDIAAAVNAALDAKDRQLVEVRRALTELRDEAKRLANEALPGTLNRYAAMGRFDAYTEVLALLPDDTTGDAA